MQESRKFECSDRLTRTHQTQSSHFCLYQTSLSSFSRSANQRRRNPHWPTQCLIPSRKAAHFLLCLQLWKAGIGRDRRCCCDQSVQEWVEAVRRAGAGRDWFEVGEQTRDFGGVESQGCRSLSCCYARCYMGCCYCCKRSDQHQVGADFAMLGIFVGRTVGLGVEVWFDMATADQICWILNLLLADLRVGLFVAVMVEAGRGRRLILLAVVMRGSELPRRDFMSGSFEHDLVGTSHYLLRFCVSVVGELLSAYLCAKRFHCGADLRKEHTLEERLGWSHYYMPYYACLLIH